MSALPKEVAAEMERLSLKFPGRVVFATYDPEFEYWATYAFTPITADKRISKALADGLYIWRYASR